MALQSWDEHRENHAALMRQLERETALSPYLEMRRWRRRFWWLLVLSVVLVVYLFLALLAKPQRPSLMTTAGLFLERVSANGCPPR